MDCKTFWSRMFIGDAKCRRDLAMLKESNIECQKQVEFLNNKVGEMIDKNGLLTSALNLAKGERDKYKLASVQCNQNLIDALADAENWRNLQELNFEMSPPIEMTGAFIDQALSKIETWQKGVFRWPLDSKYFLPTQDEMIKFIDWDWVDKKKYIADMFDCENFAFWFKARADGVMHRNNVGWIIDWTGKHGYNCIVLPDGDLWIFEPQNDHYWSIDEHKYEGAYALGNAGIII